MDDEEEGREMHDGAHAARKDKYKVALRNISNGVDDSRFRTGVTGKGR